MSDPVISPKALQEIADLVADMSQQQAIAGIDANGQPFPPGVTLIRTGAMLRSIHGEVRNGEPCVVADTDYAQYVQERIPFAGIAPQYMSEFEAKAQQILEQEITLPDTEI